MTQIKRRDNSTSISVERRTDAKSSLTEIAQQPRMKLALANDAFLSLAENAIYLRRHRGLTQARVARKMKTSQAAIARIEGACENITLRTLEKLVKALKGRLRLAISPAEINFLELPPWWDQVDSVAQVNGPFDTKFVRVVAIEGSPARAAAGWEEGVSEAASRSRLTSVPAVARQLPVTQPAPVTVV